MKYFLVPLMILFIAACGGGVIYQELDDNAVVPEPTETCEKPTPTPEETPVETPEPTPTPGDDDDDDDWSGDDDDDDDDGTCRKNLLCHVPPGNPENKHTLCLPSPAIRAHLKQHTGDYLGACVECYK